MSKKLDNMNVVANNSRATYEYFIQERIEAGLVLTGTEVKSLRQGKGSIIESHVAELDGILCLLGVDIPEYDKARLSSHGARRPRKLLMHKRQIEKISGQIKLKGMTLIPLKIYFNQRNLAKVELGLAKGKKQHDKRQAVKEREWGREKARLNKHVE